jgi:hypothetical protein
MLPPAAPAPVLNTIAPSRAAVVVGVACLCAWAWLADLGAHAGVPVVRGQALALTAFPGGQAPPDTLDAQNMAARRSRTQQR